ncbi:MAG: hypothetical protein FWF38_03085 [Spirochaetaceae bacterium]|nr:hypothetical protein [Spirochaetaceae bacterium]
MSIKRVKKNKLKLVLLLSIIIIPLVFAGILFIGRIAPYSVIPDSFIAYAHIPNPINTADKLLAHEPFSDMLLTPYFSSSLPAVSAIKSSGILEKKLVRYVGKGALEGALFFDGKFLAAWDIGIASHFIRFFPNIAGKLAITNLQKGKKSRFEYRVSDDNVIFIQPYKNLLIISNNLKLFESVFDGTSRNAKPGRKSPKIFVSNNFDAGFLVASESVVSWISASSPMAGSFLKHIEFADFAEMGLSIIEDKIDFSIISHVASGNADINKLITRDSKMPTLIQRLPAITQYSTILSIGSIEELLNASIAVSQKMPVNLRQIDRASRIFLGVGLGDLLFSWTGTEFAILGIEGRDYPLFVLQISDEQKRKEVFEKLSPAADVPAAKASIPVSQIKLPGFLNMILNMWNVKISAPYYIVQNEFLFLSESPETIFSAIDSTRKEDLLLETELWKSLSMPDADAGSYKSSLMLFYSLDCILPFFMKSNDIFEEALKLYRHGLAKVNITDGVLEVKLAAVK